MKKIIPGVNIQWPWSRLILDGKKTIETRGYSLPKKYEGIELAIIETPGPLGKKNGIAKAVIVGTVVFEGSFLYESHSLWASDFRRHKVSTGDQMFGYSNDHEKWGWRIKKVKKFKQPIPAPTRKGIIFTQKCPV